MRAKYRKVNKLTSPQIAYLAGIVDGEGTITLSRHNVYRHRYAELTISSELALEYVAHIVGAGRISTKRVYNPKHSPGYTYQPSSRQALDLLKVITPFLRTYKRKRARLILSQYLKFTPRNGKYISTMLAKRKKFIDAFFAIHPENAKTRRGGLVRMIPMEMGSIESPVQKEMHKRIYVA